MQPIPAATPDEVQAGTAAAHRPLLRRPWLWVLFVALAFATPAAGWLLGLGRPALPAYGHIPAFQLVDEQGRPFGDKDMAGKVWVIDFIFTRCPSVCPLLTDRMHGLQERLKKDRLTSDVKLLSLSVDPEYDSPAVLKAYAGKHGADASGWHFLTGAEEALEKTLVEGFKVAVGKVKASEAANEFEIVHSQKFVLVDAAGAIRGYYDADTDAGLEALYRDLGVLAR